MPQADAQYTQDDRFWARQTVEKAIDKLAFLEAVIGGNQSLAEVQESECWGAVSGLVFILSDIRHALKQIPPHLT